MYALVQSTCSVEGGLDPVDQSLLQRLFGRVGALSPVRSTEDY